MATIRQKIAASKVSESIGKRKPKSLGKILIESGYSEQTADTPQRVTETKGFQDEIRPLLSKLKRIRDSFLNELQVNGARIKKGRLDHLVKGVESFSKLIELLEGRPTERSDFPGWTYEEIKKYADTGIKPERFRESESTE